MTLPSPAAPARPLRIGTRRSELALTQSRMVQAALAARGVASELVTFDTLGDRRLDVPLSAIGEKGLFTAELEAALRAGDVDLCVHSLKDLPTELPADIAAVSLLPREDPRDVLVVRAGVAARALGELPDGSRIGTSSLRRRAQLPAAHPGLVALDIRGNVETRLRKLDEGQYEAILLAGAGLKRLGLAHRVTAWLDAPAWLSAPGQGAIAIQSRTDDAVVGPLLAGLHDAPTGVAAFAERALLNALEGGCQIPIGAAVVPDGSGAAVLHGLVAALDGSRVVRGARAVDPSAPTAAGRALAEELARAGADAILDDLRAGTR